MLPLCSEDTMAKSKRAVLPSTVDRPKQQIMDNDETRTEQECFSIFNYVGRKYDSPSTCIQIRMWWRWVSYRICDTFDNTSVIPFSSFHSFPFYSSFYNFNTFRDLQATVQSTFIFIIWLLNKHNKVNAHTWLKEDCETPDRKKSCWYRFQFLIISAVSVWKLYLSVLFKSPTAFKYQWWAQFEWQHLERCSTHAEKSAN